MEAITFVAFVKYRAWFDLLVTSDYLTLVKTKETVGNVVLFKASF